MRLTASSTMSLKVRSSSLGAGIMVRARWSRGGLGLVGLAQVERIHQVLRVGLADDLVGDLDVEAVGLVGVGLRLDSRVGEARLVLVERLLAVVLGARRGHDVV